MQPLNGADAEPEDEDDLDFDGNGEAEIVDDNDMKHAKEATPPMFIFFDFETTQEKVAAECPLGQSLEHVPNVCVAHIVCDMCRHREPSFCSRCGENRRLFTGSTCLDDFCDFLFQEGRKNVIAIAHNAKGFDGQFIMQYLFKQGIIPNIISKGLELMTLSVGQVKLIDSFNFLPMALSALPKAFGVNELAKGYFPHLFNTVKNWDYVGPWPEIYYYSAASMKEEARATFLVWHAQQLGKVSFYYFEENLL